MRTVQRIKIVVDRERRRRPTGGGGVAHRAIRRQVQRRVARIGTLAIIRAVAAVARVRRVRVIAVVARVAIARNQRVCSCEGIHRIVVKRGRCPSSFRMARRTICGKLLGGVVRSDRLCIIVCVATVTRVRRRRIIPVVTRCAIV
jgi:hypothetical protein